MIETAKKLLVDTEAMTFSTYTIVIFLKDYAMYVKLNKNELFCSFFKIIRTTIT